MSQVMNDRISFVRFLRVSGLLPLAFGISAVIAAYSSSAAASLYLLGVYPAAHAFCYFLLRNAASSKRPGIAAAAFSGAVLSCSLLLGLVFAAAILATGLQRGLGLWPVPLIFFGGALSLGLLGAGLGYGISLHFLQRFWVSSTAGGGFLALIVEIALGAAETFAVVIGVAWLMASPPATSFILRAILLALGLWAISLPHFVFAAWQAARTSNDVHAPASTAARGIRAIGVAAAIVTIALYAWAIGPTLLPVDKSTMVTVTLGDRVYAIPQYAIVLSRLDRDRPYVLVQAYVDSEGRLHDGKPLLPPYGIFISAKSAGELRSRQAELDCAQNFLGSMSGCWRRDAEPWHDFFKFPKPRVDFSITVMLPRVVSRADIVALDQDRSYAGVRDGLIGFVYVDDGAIEWKIRASALPLLDRTILDIRAMQARLRKSAP